MNTTTLEKPATKNNDDKKMSVSIKFAPIKNDVLCIHWTCSKYVNIFKPNIIL